MLKRIWDRLKARMFLYLLEADMGTGFNAIPENTPQITLVTVNETLPELEKIREKYIKKVNKNIKDLEVFVAIVRTMNDGLEDERLDSPHGTLLIIEELERYGILTQNRVIPRLNLADSKIPGLYDIFFDV